MRSTRSSSRARTDERGQAVIAALALAILYFALIGLLLVDSSRALASARRFRARVVAATLAENAAELAAEGIVNGAGRSVSVENADGTMSGSATTQSDGRFELVGNGTATGVMKQDAWVRVIGRVQGTAVRIDFTMHSQ